MQTESLSALSGDSVRQHIKRMTERLMSRKLTMNFNLGKVKEGSGKHSFNSYTNLYEAMRGKLSCFSDTNQFAIPIANIYD